MVQRYQEHMFTFLQPCPEMDSAPAFLATTFGFNVPAANIYIDVSNSITVNPSTGTPSIFGWSLTDIDDNLIPMEEDGSYAVVPGAGLKLFVSWFAAAGVEAVIAGASVARINVYRVTGAVNQSTIPSPGGIFDLP